MTWPGETSGGGSGLYIFTDDGSPAELIGNESDILVFQDGLPIFVSQASLTGVTATASVAYKNYVTVAQSGGDFTSLKSAVDSIVDSSSLNEYMIEVFPGTYVENPINIPPGVSINANSATIIAADNSQPLISTSGSRSLCSFKNLTTIGPTGSYAFSFNNSTVLVQNAAIINFNRAIHVTGDDSIVYFLSSVCSDGIGDSVGFCLYGGSGILSTISVINTNIGLGFCGGHGQYNNTYMRDVNYGIRVDGGTLLNINTINFEGLVGTGIFLNNGSSSIVANGVTISNSNMDLVASSGYTGATEILSSKISTDKFNVYSWDNIRLNFYDNKDGDQALRAYSELSVGAPEIGRETILGEGDSYTRGMLVYTSGAGEETLVDVSVQSRDLNISTTQFPGITADNSIYISSDLYNKEGRFFFHGIKCLTDTLANYGTGDIITEIWNGTSWTEITTMSTRAHTDYAASGLLKFMFYEEQIRFNARDVNTVWQRNDIIGDGIDRYWVRFRITSDISYSPVFNQIKLHSSKSEISSNGFMEFFGNARPVGTIPWDISMAQPASDSPGRQDVFVSDTLNVGRDENEFNARVTDRTGFAVFTPLDMDTSTPLKLIWSWCTNGNDVGNTIRWIIRLGTTQDGDNVYQTIAQAPSTGPNETETIVDTEQLYNEYIQQTAHAHIDISSVVPGRDILWIILERDGDDSFNEDCAVIQVIPRYLKWNNGGNILGEYCD